MAKTEVKLSLPGWLLLDLKVVTAKLGISRDDLIAQALRRYIEQGGRQLLVERVEAALVPVGSAAGSGDTESGQDR
jgi:metal-responsive CopG/Arc/MetJ family transcriptional regulator